MMKKKVLAVILLFLIGTFIVGCSGTITPKTTTPKEEFPSEADGRKCFENVINNSDWTSDYPPSGVSLSNLQSYWLPLSSPWSDKVKVVGFEKTNGYTTDYNGSNYYVMECKVTVQALEDLIVTDWDTFGQKVQYTAGTNLWSNETIPFQKTEKGWRGPDGNIY